jgi:hypothetical protein
VFALENTSFAGSTGGVEVAGTSNANDTNSQGLAGAAAASDDEEAPAHINIIDVATSSSWKAAEQTTIPF